MPQKMEHDESIDIDKLADSLRGKLKNLHPLPTNCCIYRVPQQMRWLNPKAHTPQLLSIGPFHHHANEELKAMEELKIRYLERFLQRTEVSIEDFLASIKTKEAQLLDCYAETIGLERVDFLTMILVDAVFLIEFLLRYSFPLLITSGDPLFTKSKMISDMWLDIWLLENQLPLFILNDLFNLAKTAVSHDHYNGVSLLSLTRRFYKDIHEFPLMEPNLFETHFSQAEHFLDLLRLCFQPPKSRSLPQNKLRTRTQNIPTATELHQAGVKFWLGSRKNIFDITFNKGILEIPLLRISESTEIIFRNLQAYERLHCGTRYRWHKWKAMLKQDYFNSPWASISVIAAIILLLLTLVQAVCSIIGL